MALKLTRTERWILVNQYRILEALYPKEARDFARDRYALEHGFEGEYPDIIPNIYDESEGLSAEECSEVIQIMDMHRALKRSYEALKDKTGIKEYGIKFQGFDGNNETAQMAYARHFCSGDGGKFTELDRGDDFNSHGPELDVYRRMMKVWRRFDRSHELTREQIIEILDARVHPSNRKAGGSGNP